MFTSHVKLYDMNKFDVMTMYRSCLRRNKRLINVNMFLIKTIWTYLGYVNLKVEQFYTHSSKGEWYD